MSQWSNLNESISNGEAKDKSALEKASEFATKCLQGLAPLNSKPTAADGLVKSIQRTTARKSTSNRLQIPNIKPEATSAKSPVKTEPPFKAPKPEEAPAKIAVKPQKKPKTNSKVTVKIEEVKPAAPSEPPASFDRCDGVEHCIELESHLFKTAKDPIGWASFQNISISKVIRIFTISNLVTVLKRFECVPIKDIRPSVVFLRLRYSQYALYTFVYSEEGDNRLFVLRLLSLWLHVDI